MLEVLRLLQGLRRADRETWQAKLNVRVAACESDEEDEEIVRIYDQYDLSGPNQVTWNGSDGSGGTVSPGLYVVRLSADTDAGETTEMRSMAVVY